MKSKRSRSNFVTVNLLFYGQLPYLLNNCFSDFLFIRIKNYRLSLKRQTIKDTQMQLHGRRNYSYSLLKRAAKLWLQIWIYGGWWGTCIASRNTLSMLIHFVDATERILRAGKTNRKMQHLRTEVHVVLLLRGKCDGYRSKNFSQRLTRDLLQFYRALQDPQLTHFSPKQEKLFFYHYDFA